MNEAINPREAIGANQPPLAEQLAISEEALFAEAEAVARRANEAPKELTDANVAEATALIGRVVVDANALSRRLEDRRKVVKDPYLRACDTVDELFGERKLRMRNIAEFLPGRIKKFNDAKRDAELAKQREEARKAEEEAAARRRAAEDAEAKGRERTAGLNREKAEIANRQAEEARQREADVIAAAAPPQQLVKQEVSADVSMTSKAEWKFEVGDYEKVDLDAIRPFLKSDHIDAALRLAVRNGKRTIGGVRIYQDTKIGFK